ncbi:MAG: hypothetical protein JWQ09_5360 [Segetibacter sp.]|nr:hypothetical protein [Segetibacter sp.]
MEENKKMDRIARRKFLYRVLPLIASSAIVFPFKSTFSGFFNRTISTRNNKTILKPGKRRKRNRGNWSKENLVLNIKTNVAHYPSAKIFKYYNKIADKHISVVEFNSWKNKINSPKHFNKSKSGIIIEILALKELSIPITNDKLRQAIASVAIAFSKEYNNQQNYQMNSHNWRLYDLLLQLIVLNTSIKRELKWDNFSKIIQLVDFKQITIPKKNNWVNSKGEFDKRVDYMNRNIAVYKKRIETRIE